MKREFKLEPSSDRYRICPNCETEFMTPHRTRKFCEDWCRNEYHNAIKRKEGDQKVERGSVEWNVKMLNGLNIPPGGLNLSMYELKAIGVDISKRSSMILLQTTKEGDVYLFRFDKYYLRRINDGAFLLTKEMK